MKDDNYIVIQGWMRNELNLKGNELMVYALIYGFCQDEEDEFTGSIGYIAEWLGTSKQTVHNTLKKLLEEKLLTKMEFYNNGVKFCKYKTLPVVKKIDEGVVKKLDGGSKKTLPNNIDNNTKENNIVDNVVEVWNATCSSLPKVLKVDDKRRKRILARVRENGIYKVEVAFHKVEESDFLSGRDGKWRNCNFDWLFKNSNNITKVLEGNYDNRIVRSRTEQELINAYNDIGGDNGAEPYDVI